MYIDLIIFIILLIFIFLYGKRFQTYIFGIVSVDILFRLLHFLKNNIAIKSFQKFVKGCIPKSIPKLIDTYTNDTINLIITWIYIFIVILFLIFILKIFIKRKKIV